MAVSNPGWEKWLERLYNLRRDKSGSHERPHKPALLLSIIDLLDRGVITRNEVPLSDELVATFKRYFAVVRKQNDQPTIQNPFFHLCGDKFWRLVPAPGEREIYQKERLRARPAWPNCAAAWLTGNLTMACGSC
jgi:putative restriction endonuclease